MGVSSRADIDADDATTDGAGIEVGEGEDANAETGMKGISGKSRSNGERNSSLSKKQM